MENTQSKDKVQEECTEEEIQEALEELVKKGILIESWSEEKQDLVYKRKK